MSHCDDTITGTQHRSCVRSLPNPRHPSIIPGSILSHRLELFQRAHHHRQQSLKLSFPLRKPHFFYPTSLFIMSATNPESAFTFLSQGALIQEFKVAGQNIVQSFPEASFYKTHNDAYLGETIGRTTNRVKGARIENLNGQNYRLAVNDGDNPNSLHGGSRGWGKQDFEGPKPVNRNGKEGVRFRYVSKDGEEGYPGTVECLVWYTAGIEGHMTVLEIEYQVELVGDECQETVCGVTNHRYGLLLLLLPPRNSQQ